MDLKNKLEELKVKVKDSKGLKENNYSEYLKLFEEIAKLLFNQYKLVKNNIEDYEFTEIEFYLRTFTLNDTCVHRYAGMDAGCFRIHYSGVDITIGSSFSHEKDLPKGNKTLSNQEYYGGILIRGLKKNNEYIMGPLKIQHELFSGLSLDKSHLSLSLEKKTKTEKEIYWTTRQGVSGEFENAKLCCYDEDLKKECEKVPSRYPAWIRFKTSPSYKPSLCKE